MNNRPNKIMNTIFLLSFHLDDWEVCNLQFTADWPAGDENSASVYFFDNESLVDI